MCSFEIPSLLYYAYIPALFVGIIFGCFIYLANKKSEVNLNLTFFVASFCAWLIDSFLTWFVVDPKLNLFFERMSVLELVSMVFFVYFAYSFVGVKLGIKRKILIATPLVPVLGLLFTNYNAYVFEQISCQVQNGPLYYYVYLIAIAYVIWSATLFLRLYARKDIDFNIKRQIRILIGAIAFLVVWFLALTLGRYFLVSHDVLWGDNLFLFVPLGMVIFIGMLSTAIVRYKLFNIKLIAAQALTYSIWLLIGSQFFFVENRVNIVLIAITLLFSVVFGVVLIRSVRAEIQRKEELQIMADRLAVANDELRKLDNAKTEFISIASHQLRTPLTAIKGFVSLLLEGAYGEVNPEAREAINKIHLSGERLIRLVEDLLNVSRIEAGRMIFEKKPGQFEDVVKEICEGLEMLAREKNLYLDWKLPEEKLPSFDFDASKMKEVVSNLVENAIKYSDKGGVTVRVERTQQTTNDKSQDGGTQEIIRFTVSDTGIGIPADEIPNLFKKFSRGKNTKRLNATGTGLGLFVVKNIVENHGGRIWIESKGDGMGTKFVMELPIESL